MNEAMALVAETLKPASIEALGVELAKLFAGCARRRDDSADVEAKTAVYLEHLVTFPADLALAALGDWRRSADPRCKWFPTLQELTEAMDFPTRQRRARAAALERLAAGEGVEAPALEAPASPEVQRDLAGLIRNLAASMTTEKPVDRWGGTRKPMSDPEAEARLQASLALAQAKSLAAANE